MCNETGPRSLKKAPITNAPQLGKGLTYLLMQEGHTVTINCTHM